jgi:GNAT superfamily N-acetyltransferase
VLTRHDVGHRVVIRRVLPAVDGRRRYADVVGQLLEVSRTDLTIRTGRGDVLVPHDEVDVAKRIPDQRPLSATGRLERIAAAGWPTPDVSQLGDWVLRAADGWTARGNSALAIGHPGLRLPEAVDAVTTWYGQRGALPAITVPEPIGGRVTAELTARGWTADPPALMQIAALDRLAARAPGTGRGTRADDAGSAPVTGAPVTGPVRLDTVPSESWLATVTGYKGTLPAVARDIITGVRLARYAGVHAEDGTQLAVARGVIAEDGDWLGLSLITVVEPARRRGLATATITALAGWAIGEGASRAYLQVQQHNTGAVALYERLGFSTHHRYLTWRPQPPSG